jgi:hypothetical protein
MSTVGNGITGASDTGPASGYNLELSHLLVVFFLFLYRLSVNTSSPYDAIMLLIFTHIMICFIIYGIKICRKMTKSLTIQKLECRDRLSITSFAAALKSNAFNGSNYKRWRDRMILWLTAMNIIHVENGKPEQFTPEEEQAFMAAGNLFRGTVISVLIENLVDFYLTVTSGKELWDALETKYSVSDARSELYVGNRSIVEQAHKIQSLVKELECFKCVLPGKFVAGGIIVKLPST